MVCGWFAVISAIKTTACTPLPRLMTFSMPTAKTFSISGKRRKPRAIFVSDRSWAPTALRIPFAITSIGWRDAPPGTTPRSGEAFVLPIFGDKKVSELEADDIRKWHREIAKTPARSRTKAGAAQAYRADNLQEPETQRKRQASANRCLGLLKAALNLAWREKRVESNDAWQRVELFRGVAIFLGLGIFPLPKRRG
jgi:hypothetical protein